MRLAAKLSSCYHFVVLVSTDEAKDSRNLLKITCIFCFFFFLLTTFNEFFAMPERTQSFRANTLN